MSCPFLVGKCFLVFLVCLLLALWAMTCEIAFCIDEMRSFAVLKYVSLPWGDHLSRKSRSSLGKAQGLCTTREERPPRMRCPEHSGFSCEHLGRLAIDQTRQETILDGVAQCVPELCPQTAVVCSSWCWKKVVPPERGQVGQNLPAC